MRKNFLDSLIGRPNTLKTQKSLYNKWIEPHLPEEPNEMWIESMAQLWLDEGLKPGSVRQIISLAKTWATWEHGVTLNTAQLSRKLGRLEDRKDLKVWDKEACQKALDTARHLDSKLYRMMLFTLHTGLRKSEMFALAWKDIDLVSGKILVRNSKTGRPRNVPLSMKVEDLFQKGYVVGAPSDHLFPKTEINGRLKKICEYAEVEPLTWHGLRHTFATLALESGQSPKLVSTVLGHASVATTLNIYWHCLKEDLDMGFLP
jgi:integrase